MKSRVLQSKTGSFLRIAVLCLTAILSVHFSADPQEDLFRDLGDVLPAPNEFRTSSGRPGSSYWQQAADYEINVTLDPDARRLTGSLVLTYSNNSPDDLETLWLHLDQNRFSPGGSFQSVSTVAFPTPRGGGTESGQAPSLSIDELHRQQLFAERDFGMTVTRLTDARNNAVPYLVQGTLMRVSLPQPVRSGRSVRLKLDWTSELIEARPFSARSGYEVLEDGALIVGAAQWFPRVAAYTDVRGWHLEQYLGGGEFALEFGNYEVTVNVPDTFIVAATGELANGRSVLTPDQRQRLESAGRAERPIQVVTPEEAAAARQSEASGTKSWRFRAETVRDFAWAASPAFIWDAMGVAQDDRERPVVMAMSFYPDEGDPLWGRYATEAIAHTLETFSQFTFPYPYPTAQAVNGPIASGMEYPMISFNGPRPENVLANGERTYSRYMKHRIIGIIVHETGHFYFPMIVNTDERRWVWMDEGMTSFLELISNLTFEDGFDEAARTRSGVITNILATPQRPLMTTPDSDIVRRNAYDKTAMALFVLRETILGREVFDQAFRSYANAWKFKRPEPADFFRIMGKESGHSLDWFWRAWFFTTDHVDVAVEDVVRYQLNPGDPETKALIARAERQEDLLFPRFEEYNRADGITPRAERRPHLKDFYSETDPFTPGAGQHAEYEASLLKLDAGSRQALAREARAQADGTTQHYTIVRFRNVGGVPTPLPLRLTFSDDTAEFVYFPADVWRRSTGTIEKLIVRPLPIVEVAFDPYRETLDTDLSNNTFPPQIREAFMPVALSPRAPRNQMLDMDPGEAGASAK